MSKLLTIYHGSPQIIEKPELSKCKPNNDYGRGFYCTESIELAFIESTVTPRTIYLPKKLARDTGARAEFRQEKTKTGAEDEVYILDIIRGRWQNDDPRIQRILLR